MPKPSISTLQRLIQEVIFPFYQIERRSPLFFAPGRHENDAEHSWAVALFACALAPHIDPKLDTGKICQFAVVHDLVEVYAGDTSNFASDAEKAGKTKREAAALKRLQAEFKTFAWITDTIQDYEAQQSAEARFVKAVDKLEPLLMDCIDEGLLYRQDKIASKAWIRFMQKHREKAGAHAGVFEYYDEVWNYLLAHPHFFHQDTK